MNKIAYKTVTLNRSKSDIFLVKYNPRTFRHPPPTPKIIKILYRKFKSLLRNV